MTASEPSPGGNTPDRGRRKVLGCGPSFLIVAALMVLGLAFGIYRMVTYNPNYVTVVYDANRLTLKSGEDVVIIGVYCEPGAEKRMGAPAADFTKECVLDRYIRVEKGETPLTVSGEILGYVFVEKDGEEVFLNEELLRHGFGKLALAFPNLKYRKRLEAAEAEAKTNKVGFWRENDNSPGH